ncbi:MAG: hypothetical protein GY710_06400 [Desulfobacteraceae bacterium]|nr:hypothetical protein [Desulfobacteraceae bacterium]
MATSKVKICNLALVNIGVDTIQSLTDSDSKGAVACNSVYDTLVEELLRLYPWNFALAKATLPLESSAPLFGYTYSYTLPGDCMKVVRLEVETDQFVINSSSLETDTENAQILYVQLVTDPVQFDSTFVTLLAARIATAIVFTMTGKKELMTVFDNKYNLLLKSVIDIDASETKQTPDDDTTILDSRS